MDNVELLAAVLFEKPLGRGAIVGPVTACILRNMFRTLMAKDYRFFNHPENPRQFSRGDSFVYKSLLKGTPVYRIKLGLISRLYK